MLNARQIAFRARAEPNTQDHIKYLSAPVGSGKTAEIIESIKRNQDRNYIFVSPTQKLAREIKNRLDAALVDNGQGENVYLITSEAIGPEPVVETALEFITHQTTQPHTLIITTETFRRLLPQTSAEQKAVYDVFMDEGIDPLESEELKTERQGVFLEPISQEEDGSIHVREEHEDLIRAVSYGQAASFNREELNVSAYIKICKLLSSDIYDVYASIGPESIRVIAFLRPDYFLQFRSVSILMAIFEQSLLCLFWREKYDINFQQYETTHDLYDTHTRKGPQIRIHHLLHEGDKASSLNLKRNWRTGEQNVPARSNLRVIDRMAEIINDEFGLQNIPYCWAANSYFKNPYQLLTPQSEMPANSAGLNEYRLFPNVVSLLSMNPPPWVKNMVLEQIQISDEDFYALWKLSYTYQTIGRCSLRIRNFEDEIRLVVLSNDCAERLADLFTGATVEGQLGNLPHFGGMRRGRGLARNGRRYPDAANTAWSRYREENPNTPLSKEEWFENVFQQ